MNKLEKFFNTLTTANSKLLKRYTTDELVSQIKEYSDYTTFILKNIYRLLISQNSDDRKNGAKILKSIMYQFKLLTNFKIEFNESHEEYLSSTGEEFLVKKVDVHQQKRLFKKLAKLEHVEDKIVSDIDFKPDSNITIKKEKSKDKDIHNVNDFFDNITNNLLSYEWNKRHGAFLAFSSMFSEKYDGTIEIKVDPKLFNKIYEIIKSDKFNDFVDDKTFAPVRESAAYLLSCIYPRISKNTIIDELIKFLNDQDWQTQFSGLLALSYLKDYIGNKEYLCMKLEELLVDSDEDVKFLAADLLCHFEEFCNHKSVLKKCWDNIRLEEEIAVSKTSILTLITTLYTKNSDLKFSDDNIKYIYPCFTSPIPEVRISVLDMAKKIAEESIDFLLAEMILIEEKENIRSKAIEILEERATLSNNLVAHFMKIFSGSLYEPYSKNDFVSYDDVFFTKSGIKSIGKDVVLKNRIKLFKCLIGKTNISIYDSYKTIIGETFSIIYNKFNEDISNEINLFKLCRDVTSEASYLELKSMHKQLGCNEDNEDEYKLYTKIESNTLEEDYKTFKDLKLCPQKELKRKLSEPETSSIHPLGNSYFVDYIRLQAVRNTPQIDSNIIALFKYETCADFLSFISELVIFTEFHLKNSITPFLYNAYSFLIEGFDNFLLFFSAYGDLLITNNFFNFILKNENRLRFFEKTIQLYSNNLSELKNIYNEALEEKNGKIITGFMSSVDFVEDFVSKMLDSLDVNLLHATLKSIDHSYYPLFVKPLLKIISSNNEHNVASEMLSSIIPTLNFNISNKVSHGWIQRIIDVRKSLDSLLDIRKMPDYEIRCPVKLKLRSYQVEGIKWLSFLHSFNLNGILADDMGLGKTIQVLTFICSEMYNTDKKSIVICPSSLTGHWKSEIEKYYPDIRSSIYKRNKVNDSDILIVSYETFRNEYKQFIDVDWFYIVVDEGHVLRNSNTLLYSRICMFKSTNKIVLTGTPIHNSVDDLISLFNFIMPNYLSLEKDITPLSVKMNDKEMEKMHDRLNTLHKKILPFVLRRLKIDVLKDLPPKIIRDITVEMGPEQSKVYHDIYEKSNVIEGFNYNTVKNKGEGLKRTKDLLHASSHLAYFKESDELSCKVRALDDIISLCGGDEIRNKILIFFQYKSTIDFVIKDITKKYKLKYLRLDGSVQPSKRSKIAEDFNTGNVSLLFLTTQVGGLGLNLTGADTVVFYEHDWNPFNDLQAMDRAHRLGQKNTVNVFRIIAKGTLEERVMDLQSFKMFIASSLVSQQNADIETMDTKDLLERFKKDVGT